MELAQHEALDHGTLAEWALGEMRYAAVLHACEQITNSIKSQLLAGTVTRSTLHTDGIVVRLDPCFIRSEGFVENFADEAMLNALHSRLNGMVAFTLIGKAEEWGVNFNVRTYT